MKDATRAAALVFGGLLAEDIEPLRTLVRKDQATADDRHFVAVADSVLRQIERLDVGVSEEQDRDRELLQYGPGEVWLRIAESDRMPRDYVNHVLGHLNVGGYVGPPYVRALLQAIALADEPNRDSLALGSPEYVGLWRAYCQVPNAVARMRAAVRH